MKKNNHLFFLVCILIFICMIVPYALSQELIDFESGKWNLLNAKVVNYLDRKALMGSAILKDVIFENGILEVDLAFEGIRSFAGINFRIQPNGDLEHFYMRPHATGQYNALQYTPLFNGITCWKIYSLKGYTAAADIPYKKWIHLKIMVAGNQARMYLDNSDSPALIVDDLKHGQSKGSIGLYLMGPANSAYFSNFKYTIDENLKFEAPAKKYVPDGLLMNWKLSEVFKLRQVNREKFPGKKFLTNLKWQDVTGETDGLVNISRFRKRTAPEGQGESDCIYAHTNIRSERAETKRLIFGYSDEITIYLNGNILFSGNSNYRSRDPQFSGIIGFNDAVYLNLKKGNNDLMFVITETFGGWGFKCILDDVGNDPVYLSKKVKKIWETEQVLSIPESILYDQTKDVLYVSNYYNFINPEEKEFISKVKLNGEIENLKWATGINRPTGMALFNNKLYVVERTGLVEIDTETGKVLNNYKIQNVGAPNDIVVDETGSMYITDMSKSVIYKFKDSNFDVWLKSPSIINPNGIELDNGKLYVGTSNDSCIKSINISDKSIESIACFNAGTMDGVKKAPDGGLLISISEGLIFHIDKKGGISKLIDSTALTYTADMEEIIEKNIIFVPTFIGNSVTAYEIKLEK